MPLAIAVVGYGVAGATAALLLADQGHAVTLFEQAPKVEPVGAGVMLQPSGQWVLGQLGLLGAATRRAEPLERILALTHRRARLVELRYQDLAPGCHAYGLHRGDLFTVLAEAVAARPITVRLGCRVARLREGGASLLSDEGGGRHGPFDLIIAADGSRSRLRAEVPHRVTPYLHGALWALGRSSVIRGHLFQVTRGTQRLCGLLPMGEGRCSLFWSLHRDQHEPLLRRGMAAFRAEVLALCPEAEELLAGFEDLEALRFTTYQHARLPRFFHDGCLFLGDAAHAMSPHLGQGINLALLDAYLFARCLAAADGKDNAQRIATAADRYQREREGPLRFYSLLTYALSPFFQSDGFIKGLLRDRFLPLLPKVPMLRRQMLLSVAGVKAGWLGGPLALPGQPPLLAA